MASTTSFPRDDRTSRHKVHGRLVATYQRSNEPAASPQATTDGTRALNEFLTDITPALMARVRLLSQPGDDTDDLGQQALIAAVSAARTWCPDGGAAPLTWAIHHVDRALNARARARQRLDRGAATLEPLESNTEALSHHQRELELRATRTAIAITLRRACASLPPDLASGLERSVADVVAGARDELGGRGTRSVGARSILAHPATGLRPLLEEEGWWDEAACRGHDPADFFPGRGVAVGEKARAACDGCPVRSQCLTEAVEMGLRVGYRGGMSAKSRRKLASVAAYRRRYTATTDSGPLTSDGDGDSDPWEPSATERPCG
jgi:WhiB family redox-sensing transcriptional regulator